MDNYQIMLDRYGRVYLSHGIGKRAHKYILKIGDGVKARYLYTREEVNAYMNEKKAKREADSNKVSMKQYLTGGVQQDIYRGTKKQSREDAKKEKEAKKNRDKAMVNYEKALSAYTGSKGKDTSIKTMRLGTKADDAKKEWLKAESEYRKAQAKNAKTEKRLHEHEQQYESSSFAGQMHRTARKGKKALGNLIKSVGNRTLSALNTPSVYVRKK